MFWEENREEPVCLDYDYIRSNGAYAVREVQANYLGGVEQGTIQIFQAHEGREAPGSGNEGWPLLQAKVKL